MFTLTGATEKNRENAMLQNIVNFGAKIQTRKTISDSRPTTNRSTLLTMFTRTGAFKTKNHENAMLILAPKFKRDKRSRIRGPPPIDPPYSVKILSNVFECRSIFFQNCE